MNYDDIIGLPHHVSDVHPQMSVFDRAAQFSPFASLTGYHAEITETERQTESEREFQEDSIIMLDRKLHILAACTDQNPQITLSYFQPDNKKEGGAYITESVRIKRVDVRKKEIMSEDGKRISFAHIVDMDGDIFDSIL